MSLSAEADARGVAHETADTGTDAWLARLTGDRREVLAGRLWIAKALQEKYAATREAFAAGMLRTCQVRVIVRAGDRAPSDVTPSSCASAEESLVAMATARAPAPVGRGCQRLRQAARRMFVVASAPSSPTAHEADLLRQRGGAGRARHLADAARQRQRHLLRSVQHPRAARPPAHRRPRAVHVAATPGSRPRPADAVVDETVARRPQPRRAFGAAFCELLEHLPTDGLRRQRRHPPGHPRSLVSCWTGSAPPDSTPASRISAGEARLLACNAGLVPAVLSGRSEPLDLGRERRLHSIHERRALALDPRHLCRRRLPAALCGGARSTTTGSPGHGADAPTSATHYPCAVTTIAEPTTPTGTCVVTPRASTASTDADRRFRE